MDLADPQLREDLAMSAYYRDRTDDVCLDQEHVLEPDVQYFARRWECLTREDQRPYRAGVEVALDMVMALA